MWLSGNRLPSQINVERLIPKLVELLDLEVYDILGLPRPDENLQRLTQAWSHIPVKYQQMLAEQAEKFAAEGEEATKNVYEVKNVDQVKKADENQKADNVDEVNKKDEVPDVGEIRENTIKEDGDQ